MAKLERVTAKVFASDAPADKIGQFGSALAGTKLETGDVSTIQALPAYTEGWSSAVISQRNYPVLQETNGVMKNMSYQTAYIMQNGIAEYDPNTEYYAGSICKGIGNTNQYASWGDENVGNAVTNSDYWKNVTPVNYSNITNCITEIPQRIKLELNNGTLTLKAGSEVIVPNGFEADGTTKKFDYVIIERDVTYNGVSWNGECFVFYSIINNDLGAFSVNHVASGTTQPTNEDISIWYDTANNIIKEKTNGVWVAVNQLCLPLAMAMLQTAIPYVISIDQVFNGFGYIGSTVWVDKGVKGLIPNGRNEDGSLNNIDWVNNNIIVTTQKLTNRNNQAVFLDIITRYAYPLGDHYTVDNYTNEEYNLLFDNKLNNYYYNSTDGKYSVKTGLVISFANIDENSNYTSFNPKQPFKAVDYNDKSEISGWGMPSDKYIDLTVGASGTTYTARANGYFVAQATSKASSGAGNNLVLTNSLGMGIKVVAATNGQPIMTYTPVRRGEVITLNYTTQTPTKLRFIYAEGEV